MLEFYRGCPARSRGASGCARGVFGGNVPLTGFNIGQGFRSGRRAGRWGVLRASAHYQIVGARYFETLGIPSRPAAPSPPATITRRRRSPLSTRNSRANISRAATPSARTSRCSPWTPAGPKPVDREIVGVSGQVKVDALGESENAVEIYVPITQNPWFDATLAVRTEVDPQSLTAGVRAALAQDR